MALYLVFFVLGFLMDKLRIFPLLLGIVLGIVLKSLVGTQGIESLRDLPTAGTQLYNRAAELCTKLMAPSEKVDQKQ
jgi:hypothetical protein